MPWPFRRKPRLPPWDLSTELFSWCEGAPFSIGDACQGVGILGSTGSGKSSGSFSMILSAYLKAGFGGVFFTAKSEDTEHYLRLARAVGRSDDVIVFSPESDVRFNFISEELGHGGPKSGAAENLASLILTAVELLDRSGPSSGGDNRMFVLESTRLLRNAILVLLLAQGTFTMTELHRLIVSAPQTLDEVQTNSWYKSYCFDRLAAAEDAAMDASMRADFELAYTYFAQEWPALSSRTRSSVQVTLTSTTDLLSRGLVRDMLSAPKSTFSAEMLYQGKVLIAAFPVLRYKAVGQLIQVILKYILQRAHARRDVRTNPRPTFMAADEAQLLWVSGDQEFQGITRSTRTAVVYATQSISTMLEAFGRDAEPKVHSLLGNLQTRICHQQTDIKTIEYMQQLIGRSRRLLFSGNSSGDDWMGPLFGERSGNSAGFSEHYEYELEAGDLNALAKGGPPHWHSEAVVYSGGRRFPDGRTWRKVAIPQFR